MSLSEIKSVELELKDGFNVINFIGEVNVDYVFSKKKEDYLLLNIQNLGVLKQSDINKLIAQGQKVAIIEGLHMEVFNVDEGELLNAMLNL